METWQVILGALVLLLPPILNWKSSRDYRITKDAEFNTRVTEYTSKLSSKDEIIRTIEEKYDSMVASKDEQIKLYEKLSSPQIMERYDKKITGLEKTVDELNAKNDELNQIQENVTRHWKEEEGRRKQLEMELENMKAPKEVRSTVSAYTAGSLLGFEQMAQFVSAASSTGVEIQRKAEELVKAVMIDIDPPPTDSETVSDIAKVEITGPEDELPASEDEA